jgi:hypothetical protein
MDSAVAPAAAPACGTDLPAALARHIQTPAELHHLLAGRPSSQLRCCTPIPQMPIMQPRHVGSLPHMSVTVSACLQQLCSADVSYRALYLELCLSAVAPACTSKSWSWLPLLTRMSWQSAQPGICRTRCFTYRNSQPNSQSRAMICCFGAGRLSAKENARSPSASELQVTASQLMPWHADSTSRTSAGSRTYMHRTRLRAFICHPSWRALPWCWRLFACSNATALIRPSLDSEHAPPLRPM